MPNASWIPHKSAIRILHRVIVHSQIVKAINAHAGFPQIDALSIMYDISQNRRDKKLQYVSRRALYWREFPKCPFL